MSRRVRGLLVAGAVAALYLLHNDLWLWDDPSRVAGLPVGLAYHLLFCFAAAAVMALAVRWLGAGSGSDDGEAP